MTMAAERSRNLQETHELVVYVPEGITVTASAGGGGDDDNVALADKGCSTQVLKGLFPGEACALDSGCSFQC